MKNLFNKQQLIEMAKERFNWFEAVGGEFLTVKDANNNWGSIVFHAKYSPKKAERFSKEKIIEAINFMDQERMNLLNQ